jgi:hypothetical protein
MNVKDVARVVEDFRRHQLPIRRNNAVKLQARQPEDQLD